MRRLVARAMWLGVVAVAMTGSATAVRADDDHDGDGVARWKDIVGIIQAGNVAAGVTGGGQPWSTLGGSARVDLRDGRIEFEVEGLVFAGGDTIGTPGAVTQVKGTLVCDANNSAGRALVDTSLVPLDAKGNARFKGDVGPLPAVCTSEPDLAFLVRVAADRWIAYGAVLKR
jgi:hypothetical protein